MAVTTERVNPSSVRSWAPGRITLVGDHTDYNFGFSLAMTLPRGTWAEVSAQPDSDTFRSIDERGPAGWDRYARACVRLVREAGLDLPPVRIDVWGDLPIGRGLSSSASLISSTLASLYGLVGAACSPGELATQAQRVENFYLGVPTGTLDQEVIVKSPNDRTVCIDFGLTSSEHLPLPTISGHHLLVVDPGLPRQLDASNYGNRRDECAEALSALYGTSDRAAWLRFREATWTEILTTSTQRSLGDLALRRLGHVWSENRRVHDLVSALSEGDVATIADLINQSHESLRDNFEVSTAPIEAARSAILRQFGIKAARLVGAGFGGCLLALATTDAVLADYDAFSVV